MDKKITSDTDIEFYRDDFNFKVFAGPGAGKTYFIVKNIISTIKNSKKLQDSQRKILCITYTNVAANEIKERLGDYKKYVEVSTIHAFLYEYVIKNYQEQLKHVIEEAYNCPIPKKIKFYPRSEGFGLLTKLKKSEFITLLKDKYKLEIANDVSKKKLSEYIIDIKDINVYPFIEPVRAPKIINKMDNISEDEALMIKKTIWQAEGVLDFDEILYFSYVLLKKYKFIAYDVQYHFPYILMDEYQDTNPIQNEMIKTIISNRNVSIGVVGDVAQSIYGFQGAKYQEFKYFNTNNKPCKTYVIDGNRRSNKHIINFLNYVRQSDQDLVEQVCIKNTNNNEKVKFVISDKENLDVITSINKDAIILCRRWADAFKYLTNVTKTQNYFLTKIHNYYRYVLDRDLIKDFENDNINWISQIRLIVKLKEAVDNGDFASIVYEMNKLFKLNLFNKEVKVHNTKEFAELQKFIKIFDSFKEEDTYFSIINTLKLSLKNIGLEKIAELELPQEGDDNYIFNFTNFLYKLELKTLRIMVNEIFTDESKFVTIHRTKGKEYDTVFVNMEPLRDEADLGGIVNVLCNPKIIDDELYNESEFVRIAYVAFSRAINNLYIFIDAYEDNVVTMFKNFDKYIKEKQIEKFYEIIEIRD